MGGFYRAISKEGNYEWQHSHSLSGMDDDVIEYWPEIGS